MILPFGSSMRMTMKRTNSWFIAFFVFFVVNILDGVLTYGVVTTYGPGAEMNPIVRWMMISIGTGESLFITKALVAVASIFVDAEWGLWTLTFLYTVLAIVPGIYLVWFA